jgi:hypothetical protein
MKKLMSMIAFVAIVGLTGCNSLGGGNVANWSTFAVVDYNFEYGGDILHTEGGTVAAPGLSMLPYAPGDCLFVNFDIDYDNQPTDKYVTVSNLQVVDKGEIAHSSSEILTGTSALDIVLTGTEVPFTQVAGGFWLQTKNFYQFVYSADKTQSIQYSFFAVEDEPLDSEDVKNIYVIARASGTSSKVEDIGDYHAFDLTRLFEFGKEVASSSSSTTPYFQLKLRINYLKAIKDGVPEFGVLPEIVTFQKAI